MLIAHQHQAEPAWVPVMGASVLFAPITRPMLRRARRAALDSLDIEGAEGGEARSVAEQMEELGDALSFALIVAGALDWRDVAQAVLDENGEPVSDEDGEPAFDALPFTAANLRTVLSDALAFEAFDAAYVIPYVQRERERAAPGKGLSPSPNGISTPVTQEPITAGSPAPLAKATDAENAPTSSTKRKRKLKKPSGTS